MAPSTLTMSSLNQLVFAEGERRKRISDPSAPNLSIECWPSGKKTAWFRYADRRGRRRDWKIGHVGPLTLDQIRREAKRLQAYVSLGGDPAHEREEMRAAPTVSRFVREVYLPDAKERLRGYANLNSYCRRIIHHLGSKALGDVTGSDVSALRKSLQAEGLANGTVNRHLATLRAIFNRAKRLGVLTGENPASFPGMLREQNRELTLTVPQEKELIKQLGADMNVGAATAVGLLMVTGARKSEILNAEWQRIDWERGELLVPLSKNGRPRRIPLSDVAVRLLRAQRARCDSATPYVFPGTVPGRPIEDLRRIWGRVKKAARLPPELRIHDLRHSMASRLANAGTPLNEIGAILGHRSLATTQRYAHFQPERLVATAAIASRAWLPEPGPTG